MPVNQKIYRFYPLIYDRLFGWVTAGPRRRTVELLALQPGERLLIPGAGTGLDLPLIPHGVQVTALDISPEMLLAARDKAPGRLAALELMDAQALAFLPGCFDAVLLNLFLSVVPDAPAAFREAWRVLRPGGRLAIFDKFLSGQARLTAGRRVLGRLIAALGTDPNRRLSAITGGLPGLEIELDEASLLRGQYRVIRIRKALTFAADRPV